jgi:hypothetical protein
METKTIQSSLLSDTQKEFLARQTEDGSWDDWNFLPLNCTDKDKVIVSLTPDTYGTLAMGKMIVGRWTDTDGTIYHDLSIIVDKNDPNFDEFIADSKAAGELALWDVETQTSVPL